MIYVQCNAVQTVKQRRTVKHEYTHNKLSQLPPHAAAASPTQSEDNRSASRHTVLFTWNSRSRRMAAACSCGCKHRGAGGGGGGGVILGTRSCGGVLRRNRCAVMKMLSSWCSYASRHGVSSGIHGLPFVRMRASPTAGCAQQPHQRRGAALTRTQAMRQQMLRRRRVRVRFARMTATRHGWGCGETHTYKGRGTGLLGPRPSAAPISVAALRQRVPNARRVRAPGRVREVYGALFISCLVILRKRCEIE